MFRYDRQRKLPRWNFLNTTAEFSEVSVFLGQKMSRVQLQPLTKEELKALKEGFKNMDDNQDGRLQKKEIADYARLNGIDTGFVELMFLMFDTDKSGTISFAEFKRYIKACKLLDTQPAGFYRLVFDALDTNKNGTLNQNELEKFFELIGEPRSSEEIATWIKAVDIKGTNNITFLEICRWLKLEHP